MEPREADLVQKPRNLHMQFPERLPRHLFDPVADSWLAAEICKHKKLANEIYNQRRRGNA
jgi:hypothetical protein